MCGIIGGISERNVALILLEGLKRLEYRGYDSAGMAVMSAAHSAKIERVRIPGKVASLAEQLAAHPLSGTLGIAHTRWATHGKPNETNAHPHMSGDALALVHNGIIENFESLKNTLMGKGFEFTSQTDTEVIAHLLQDRQNDGEDLPTAVRNAAAVLEGMYALAVISKNCPDTLVVAQGGTPLVIGVGIGEHFVASDMLALLPVTERMIVLQDGDVAAITSHKVTIWDKAGNLVVRQEKQAHISAKHAERGNFRHFMQKEIFEQPFAVTNALSDRLTERGVQDSAFGESAKAVLEKTEHIQIVACGTSFHAGLVAQYWLEALGNTPTKVTVGSEFKPNRVPSQKEALFLTISQSGETADTLAGLRGIDKAKYLASLAICNVPESVLVRGSDLSFLTCAGPEIGVASTKAFTTQLVGLLLLAVLMGRYRGGLPVAEEKRIGEALRGLPEILEETLQLDAQIKLFAHEIALQEKAIFLGRGALYPIALEGALKLKEISYIFAQGYPAGELKHGPLALIDKDMPVIISMADDENLPKMKNNLQEIEARGGNIFVFADQDIALENTPQRKVCFVPKSHALLAPIIHTLPLQLLAYHVAVLKGTDVDQPRNLAKSVTVE